MKIYCQHNEQIVMVRYLFHNDILYLKSFYITVTSVNQKRTCILSATPPRACCLHFLSVFLFFLSLSVTCPLCMPASGFVTLSRLSMCSDNWVLMYRYRCSLPKSAFSREILQILLDANLCLISHAFWMTLTSSGMQIKLTLSLFPLFSQE